MLPNTIEYGQWKTGIRSEGMVYALFMFSLLLVQAFSSEIVGSLLTAFGYVPNQTQTVTALHGLLIMQTVVPITGSIIGIIILLFYKLDKKNFSRMIEEIKERSYQKISINGSNQESNVSTK